MNAADLIINVFKEKRKRILPYYLARAGLHRTVAAPVRSIRDPSCKMNAILSLEKDE